MFCKNCGQPLNPNQAICLNCGVKVGDGTTFCANCGNENYINKPIKPPSDKPIKEKQEELLKEIKEAGEKTEEKSEEGNKTVDSISVLNFHSRLTNHCNFAMKFVSVEQITKLYCS